MTDPADERLLEDFARLLGVGGRAAARRTELEIPDVLNELAAVLDEQGNAFDRAAEDEDLLESWSTSSPEARAGVLLRLAWQARTSQTLASAAPSIAGTYAEELLASARTFAADDRDAFQGPDFPALPLPGVAGALATRLSFNADDLPISLATALVLLAMARTRRR